MITNSIFILGAGSSKEYGMPLWDELSDEIKRKVSAFRQDSLENLLQICCQHHPHLNEEERQYAVSFVDEVLSSVGENERFATIDEAISTLLKETEYHLYNEKFTKHLRQTPSEEFFWALLFWTFRELIIGEKGKGTTTSPAETFLFQGAHQTKGWLRSLIGENGKLLIDDKTNMFIDFNYDDLLYTCFCYLKCDSYYMSPQHNSSSLKREERKSQELRDLKEEAREIASEISKEWTNLKNQNRNERNILTKGQGQNTRLQSLNSKLIQINKSIQDKNVKSPIEFKYDWMRNAPVKETINLFQLHGYFGMLTHAAHNWSKEYKKVLASQSKSESYRGSEPISCHDAGEIQFKNINNTIESGSHNRLLILGLGSRSLDFNLAKINFESMTAVISSIWFTCYDELEVSFYNDYFRERFGHGLELRRFKTCSDLANALSKLSSLQ